MTAAPFITPEDQQAAINWYEQQGQYQQDAAISAANGPPPASMQGTPGLVSGGGGSSTPQAEPNSNGIPNTSLISGGGGGGGAPNNGAPISAGQGANMSNGSTSAGFAPKVDPNNPTYKNALAVGQEGQKEAERLAGIAATEERIKNGRAGEKPTTPAGYYASGTPGTNRFTEAEAATKLAGVSQEESIQREIADKQKALDIHAQGVKYGADYYNDKISPYLQKYNEWKYGGTDANGNHIKGAYDTIMEQADARAANIQKKIDALPPIDPKKVYVGGTFGQIAAAIGMALGGFGGGMTRTRNYAADIIQSNINSNIEAQKSNLENLWKKISADKDFAHDETAKGLFMIQKGDEMKLAYLTDIGNKMKNIQATQFDTPEGAANLAAQLEPLQREADKIKQNTADRMFQYKSQEYHEAQAAAAASPAAKFANEYKEYVKSAMKQNTEHPDKPVSILSAQQYAAQTGGKGSAAPEGTSTGKESARLVKNEIDVDTGVDLANKLLVSGGRATPFSSDRAQQQQAGAALKQLAIRAGLGDEKSLAYLNDPGAILNINNQARIQQLKSGLQDLRKRQTEGADRSKGSEEPANNGQ